MLNYFYVIIYFVSLCNPVHFQKIQSVNVLYINEEDNDVAEKAVEVALDYIERNTKLGIKVNMRKVIEKRDDSKRTLEATCRTYRKMLDDDLPPHIILDNTMTGPASEMVKYFTKTLGLPTISSSFGQRDDLKQWRDIDVNQEKYLIQIMPPTDIIPEIIKPIILNQNISNAAILFDQSYVMDHKFKSLLRNLATRHVIRPIEEQKELLRNQLQNLLQLDIFNFFILGSLDNIKTVLDVADSLDFFIESKFSWYVITQDNGDLKCRCTNATVLFANPMVGAKYQHRLNSIKNQLSFEPEISAAFYFDLALQGILAVKSMINNDNWYNFAYITCENYNNKSFSYQHVLNLRKCFYKEGTETPSYGPMHITSNGQSFMEFTMEINAISFLAGSIVKSISLGTWKAGLNNNLVLIDPKVMHSYTTRVVHRIVTVVQPPFVIEDEKAPKGYSGYCIDLINEIASNLKFDYEIYLAPDGKFGNMDANGNWNGIVKELMENRAEIGLSAMSIIAERETVIEFTIPYYDIVGTTILAKLSKRPSGFLKFLTVLEHHVWLCVLTAYLFTSFLMWAFDRWNPFSYQNNRKALKNYKNKREFDFKECLWFCMTSLTPQGGGVAPRYLSGRLVVATWWLFGFITTASYMANLGAFLTVSKLNTPIQSLDDLSKQHKIQYAPLNGSRSMIYFERMANIESRFYSKWKDIILNDSLSHIERAQLATWDYPLSDKYIKMLRAMKQAGFPNTIEEAVERVRSSRSSTEGFMFLGDATDLRYLTLTNCDLQMVGQEFSKKPYAIALQLDSPLKEQFNGILLQLLNRRQLERLKEKWWTNNPKVVKCERQDNESDGITIQNIGGVFIIIFAGISFASTILTTQYCWHKCKTKRGSKIFTKQHATI